MEFPIITVVQNTMMNTKNGIIELYKYNSDHALIRVEFKKFIIYSWNILNGDDKPAISHTIGDFTKMEEIKLSKEGIYKEELTKNLNKSLIDSYVVNNEERIKNIGTKLKILSEEEKKPVIFMFQELSLKSAKRIIQTFCQFDDKFLNIIEPGNYYSGSGYKVILSSQDQVVYRVGGDDGAYKEHSKDELRLTIIPNSFGLDNFNLEYFESIKSFNKHAKNTELTGYKSQLLTRISYRGKKYTLVNLHLNYQTTIPEVCNFIGQLTKKVNLIIIGDFNNNIELRLKKSIKEKFPNFNFNFKAPSDSTFIKKMPQIGVEDSERSAILDQVLYSLDDDELSGSISSYHNKYLKYKNKYIHFKNSK
jgi:hypothetical protein